MTRLGFWTRFIGALVLCASSLSLATVLGLTAGTNNRAVDHGIASSIGLVALDEVDGLVGSVYLLNLSPEEGETPRISIGLWGGDLSAEGAPTQGRSPQPRSDVEGEEDLVGGFSVVLGGKLADALGRCVGDSTVITEGLSYADLSEAERTAIVENIRTQGKDRSVAYGDRASDAPTVRSAAETATAMTYTVIDVTWLQPVAWTMTAPPPENAGDGVAVVEEAANEPQAYSGYYTMYQCDIQQESVFTDQPWGKRFEFPPITVYANTHVGTPSHVEAYRQVSRKRGNPHYTYYAANSYGYQDSKTEEESGGLYRVSDFEDSWTDGTNTYAMVSEGQMAVSFQSFTSGQWRDLSIFAAGAAVSLAASLIIAILKTLAGNRHYLPRWLGGKTSSEV